MNEPARSGAEPQWFLARRLFLGGVALTYAVAFGSLGVQVRGLFGSQGVVPLAETMRELGAVLHGAQRLQVPTLLWWNASDAMLVGLCWTGVVLAALALVGVAPRIVFALLWACYLSLVVPGEPFLSFQWDVLLLETGLLAIAFAPPGPWPHGKRERPPSNVARWLVYSLVARLLFLSGWTKLASGDPSWRDGSALDYHFWTQPLPHRLSHYVHWTPEWMHQASCAVMFAVELGAPLLVLVPVARRRCRQVAAAGIAGLMALVAATGNYGFFNLLTAILCIPLLDDRAWRALLRRPEREHAPAASAPRWRRIGLAGFATLVVVLSADRTLTGLGWRHDLPSPLRELRDAAAPFSSFNAYGLFRVMTRERYELLVEGSDDGETWKSYAFRYKPGDPRRPPVYAGLHMPRLDWQAWFVPLNPAGAGWVPRLQRRLLEGSPPVLALLAENPFPDHPPRRVRVRAASYRFSTPEERAQGVWWRCGEPVPFFREQLAGEEPR